MRFQIHRSRVGAILTVLGLVFVLSCGKKSTSSGGGGGGSNIVYTFAPNVSIGALSFVPQNDSVRVGTTITWTMATSTPHTVTSDAGLFNASLTTSGQTFSHTFNSAGQFNYHCTIHGGVGTGMFGRIKVVP